MSTLSKADAYTKMWTLAQQQREPGQSSQQAFARFAATDEGRELMQAQKPDLHDIAERRAVATAALDVVGVPETPVAKSAPSKDLWDGMIRGVMRIEKCNYTTAVSKCLATDEGRAVFKDVRRAEQIATGQFTLADIACLDGVDAYQGGYRDMHKRHARSKFEEMTEDLMSKRGLSRTKAMDYLRTTPDGLAAWQEFKSKPGAVHLPQGQSEDDGSRIPHVPTTSGRVDPSRVSQWDSPHSGSRYSPPTATPWGATETPAIKRWLDLVKRAERDYGFSRERTIEILKVLSHGKAAFDKAVAEASSL